MTAIREVQTFDMAHAYRIVCYKSIKVTVPHEVLIVYSGSSPAVSCYDRKTAVCDDGDLTTNDCRLPSGRQECICVRDGGTNPKSVLIRFHLV